MHYTTSVGAERVRNYTGRVQVQEKVRDRVRICTEETIENYKGNEDYFAKFLIKKWNSGPKIR